MEKYELTFPQKNIWLVENFYESGRINLIAGSLVIEKDFDLKKAELAVNKFVELNEAMRTRICIENNIPVQYIVPFSKFEADKIEVFGKSEEQIDAIKDEYLARPIDILNDTLYSYLLIDRGCGVGEIFLKSHHLICDAWSGSKMVVGLSNIYDKILNGDDIYEPYPSYIDYIKKESEYKQSDKYISDEAFWMEYLNGFSEAVGIRENPNRYTKAKRYSVKLEENLNKIILNFCKDNKLSPYTVFMTALAIYLERITEKKDIVIGTPILNRGNFSEKQMQGMFVSTMPVRFIIDEQETFKDICLKSAKESMSLFRHQRFPFAVTSENIKRENNVKDNLYRVMLSYQNARARFEKEDTYKMTWTFSGEVQDEFSMHIVDLNDDGILEINYDYVEDIFEKGEIEYIARRIETIIYDGIINNKKVEDICIMPEEERNKIINIFNDTARDYPKDKTVIELFEETAKKYSDKIALVFEGKHLTYSDLNNRANILANELVKRGIKTGDSVGIIVDKSFELLISILAVLKIGAYYLPIEINYAHDRKKYMLEDNNTKVVIQQVYESFTNTESILLNSIDWNKECNNILRDESYDANSPMCILYTSGTTGVPKGACVTNKNIVKLVKNPDYMEFYDTDVILQAASTSFDVSLFEFWGSLLNGGTCALLTKQNLLDFDYLNKYIKTQNVTIAWITSALFNQLIDSKLEIFETLRTVLSGGDIMSLKHVNKLREMYPKLDIINCYGPTECVTFTNTYNVTKTRKKRMPLGKAISNTYGYVIDSKFRLLPLYTEGEYVIGGDSVALYYINKPELTKEKFVQDEITNKGRMYKTGDVVRMLDEGHIDFVGRRDNQVKIRGYRIELDEIKLAIQKHNLVKDVSVFIYEDDFNQKKIAAFYTVNSHLSEEELKTYLKDNLISYMVPSYICNLEKLPLNQNGKVNVKELKQIIKSDTKKETRDITEYYGLEKQIYTIFKSVLNREDILPEDSFFEIGGDSLAAIKVISEAMKYDITITFADLYKYPSISELADMLENKLDKGSISKGIETYDYTNIEDILSLNKITSEEIIVKPLGGVLLTGATGFLGAHILEYLLNNTESIIYCLVRKSGTYNTVEEKLLNKMNFFFGDKYDEYFNDRIKVVEGDILLDSITTNEDSKQQIIDNVSTIINSAAYVKHYGNEKLFKKINTKGVEYLAKFALEYNKKLVHISTLSVSGNILEVGQIEQTNIKKGTIYNENNLYIGQNLDNIYAYTKFLGERVVYEYIEKGLNAQIMRMGNLTSRTYDGKFQPNVEENAFANRLKTIINLNVLPENLLDFNVEFTPIDKAAEAICLLAQTMELNTYHVFNHNHIVMEDLDKIFKKLGINLRRISKQEMTELIDFYTNQEKGYEMVKGVIQDLNKNKELDYTPNTKIKSDFTIDVLAKLGFYWPLVNEEYITKYIKYLDKINFFKGENK